MKKLIVLIALSSTLFAGQKGYCESLNEKFDQYLEAVEVAHEFGDMAFGHRLFNSAKEAFYDAVVSGCKKYINVPEMKETLRNAYIKYEKKEESCIK